MTWLEVENLTVATSVGNTGAKHFASLEPRDKDEFVRLRDVEPLTVHLLMLDFEILSDPLRDRVIGIDVPNTFALANFSVTQGAARAQNPGHDSGDMRRVQ